MRFFLSISILINLYFLSIFYDPDASKTQTHSIEFKAEDLVVDGLKVNDGQHRRNVITPNNEDSPGKRCSGVNRPNRSSDIRNEVWHVLQLENNSRTPSEVVIYGAYFDDRMETQRKLRKKSIIRFLVDTSVPKRNDLFCLIWSEGEENPISVPLDENLVIGRGFRVKPGYYQERMYTFSFDYAFVNKPTHVSLVATHCDIYPTIIVPLNHPVRTLEKIFTVCVAISFWNVDPYRLIEWIELSKILGIEEINVYDGGIYNETRSILRYYEKYRFVKVHKMPPPVLGDPGKYAIKLASPISLNDCMYRNMYRSKFIVVIDFDEFIIPRDDISYAQMITNIDKLTKFAANPKLSHFNYDDHQASYSFRNTFFFLDYTPTVKDLPPEASALLTQRFLESAQPNHFLYASKSFIDPSRCISVFNHYCYIRFPGYKISVDVPPEIALSHHYKYCNFNQKECNKRMEKHVTDKTMLRYQAKLTKVTLPVLKHFKLDYNQPPKVDKPREH